MIKKKELVLRYLGVSDKSAHFNNNAPNVEFEDVTWVDIPLSTWEEMHTPFEVTITIRPGNRLEFEPKPFN
jgi:hypothetical protein